MLPIGRERAAGAIGVYGATNNYVFTPIDQKTALYGLAIGLAMGIATFTYPMVMGPQDSRRVATTAYGLAFAIPTAYYFFAFYK